ncbi:MAG: HEPN domain-containing protein [Spirochaetales bacterium]|jgi:hypothetical protein|nr:HEPN domain-containing protein [Spirochaetales bacterium]
MSKSTSKERIMIVDSISRRPYGVKLSVLLDDSTRMMLHGKACLLTDTDYIINVRPIQSRVTGQADTVPGFRAWEIFVEGFATAGEAEKKGLEIAFGILWGAISERYSVRLQYQTPLPCVVYDRTRQGSGSLAVSTSATFILGKSLASIATAINEGLSSQERGNEKLLLAMELFASARQESTERSRFVGLVSSLEPLAEQQSYTGEVSGMIDRFKDQIKELKLLPHIEASLSGRIANLSTESVSSAIRRVVKETLPDDSEALRIIEDAYNLRSRILHDGTTDADLNQKSREVETVVRRVIASRAALNLRVS